MTDDRDEWDRAVHGDPRVEDRFDLLYYVGITTAVIMATVAFYLYFYPGFLGGLF